jgi:hypothetical protein
MTDQQLRDVVLFIQGKKDIVQLNCENKKEGKALYDVLAESKNLYNKLHSKNVDLNDVLEQVHIKNARAKKYFEVSGKKWLF